MLFHNALYISLPLKLPGFPVSMGQLSLYKVNMDSVTLSLGQIPFGDAHVDSVSLSLDQIALGDAQLCSLLPFLNSTAQLWPLPGCNPRPGTVMISSSLTTKFPFTLPPMEEDEPHSPFQGAVMFTTTREAIDWHIRGTPLQRFRYSFTVGQGIKA